MSFEKRETGGYLITLIALVALIAVSLMVQIKVNKINENK
jgi:hypothetical protein